MVLLLNFSTSVVPDLQQMIARGKPQIEVFKWSAFKTEIMVCKVLSEHHQVRKPKMDVVGGYRVLHNNYTVKAPGSRLVHHTCHAAS